MHNVNRLTKEYQLRHHDASRRVKWMLECGFFDEIFAIV